MSHWRIYDIIDDVLIGDELSLLGPLQVTASMTDAAAPIVLHVDERPAAGMSVDQCDQLIALLQRARNDVIAMGAAAASQAVH
jgi:hypothetical protein